MLPLGNPLLMEQPFREGRIRRTHWILPLQGWVHGCFPGLSHSSGSAPAPGVALSHRLTPCSQGLTTLQPWPCQHQPMRHMVSCRHHPCEPGQATPAPSGSRSMCPHSEDSRSLTSPAHQQDERSYIQKRNNHKGNPRFKGTTSLTMQHSLKL